VFLANLKFLAYTFGAPIAGDFGAFPYAFKFTPEPVCEGRLIYFAQIFANIISKYFIHKFPLALPLGDILIMCFLL
jgi:hypothetical protein